MAKQLPLAELHGANGAVFSERDGWSLPLHFGSPAAEHEAVRSRMGLMDLSHRAILKFTGPDRLPYLQGMISNDMRDLAPGQGLYATILNQQGKVLGDIRVFCTAEYVLLDLWEWIKEKILGHLNRYLVADDVEIADITEDYGLISVQGPQCEPFLQKLLTQAACPKDPLSHSAVRLDGSEIRLIRYSHTGEEGFDCLTPRSDLLQVAQRFTETARAFSAGWLGEQAAEVLRVEAGIPRYGVDFTEESLLLETGLDHAVSFTKGCYLGQEIVERIHSRGHVNRKLTGLLLYGEREARSRDRVNAGDKEAGIITSSVNSPTLKRPIALGYIHKDYWAPGTVLSIDRGGNPIRGTVSALPFLSARAGPA